MNSNKWNKITCNVYHNNNDNNIAIMIIIRRRIIIIVSVIISIIIRSGLPREPRKSEWRRK